MQYSNPQTLAFICNSATVLCNCRTDIQRNEALEDMARSTMGTNQLTNRMFAVMHKERLQGVNLNKVAKEFINSGSNARRLGYFGRELPY